MCKIVKSWSICTLMNVEYLTKCTMPKKKLLGIKNGKYCFESEVVVPLFPLMKSLKKASLRCTLTSALNDLSVCSWASFFKF